VTPQEYLRGRALVSLGLRGALLPLVRLLRGRPSVRQWEAFVQAAYPSVYRARVESWRLAERWYRGERERVLGAGGPVEFPRRDYPVEALDKGMRELVKVRLDALEEDEEPPAVVVEEALEVADRHAKDAGRQAVIDAARHDPEALGYARRLVGDYSCAFCTMLASRGPVYKSASSALIRHEGRGRNAVATGEPFHQKCDCETVPVFDRSDWRGRDQYLELSRAWDEHANGSLRDWRRYLTERQRREQERAAEAA
jgi:hypothetical protein